MHEPMMAYTSRSWRGAGPDDDPAVYAAADLRRRLPSGTPRVLIHGTADGTVGIEQSREFAAAAASAGDRADLLELEGEGHYAFLDPRQPAFEMLYQALDRWRAGASTHAWASCGAERPLVTRRRRSDCRG